MGDVATTFVESGEKGLWWCPLVIGTVLLLQAWRIGRGKRWAWIFPLVCVVGAVLAATFILPLEIYYACLFGPMLIHTAWFGKIERSTPRRAAIERYALVAFGGLFTLFWFWAFFPARIFLTQDSLTVHRTFHSWSVPRKNAHLVPPGKTSDAWEVVNGDRSISIRSDTMYVDSRFEVQAGDKVAEKVAGWISAAR